MSKEKYSYAQERCIRLAGKLMQQTGMIGQGDRIGVAVSGGRDSFALLKVLMIRKAIVPFGFSFMALHVNPGFDRQSHIPLNDWIAANGVAGHIEVTDHGPRAHSSENRKKSACFYCAMLRRKRLFELCQHYNLTHLAFGHNADDLVSSFLMNLMQTGRVEGMAMKEPFFKGRLSVIRPLMLVEKKYINKASDQWNLPVWKNPCPSSGHTMRSSVMEDLDSLCASRKGRRQIVFNAITRWQFEKTKGKDEPAGADSRQGDASAACV